MKNLFTVVGVVTVVTAIACSSFVAGVVLRPLVVDMASSKIANLLYGDESKKSGRYPFNDNKI